MSNTQFAVVYSRAQERGPVVHTVDVANDMPTALDLLANARLSGATPVGVFQKVPGEVVFTARILNGKESTKVKRTAVHAAAPLQVIEGGKQKRKPKPASVRDGQKRTPTQLQRTRQIVQDWIAAHPGERVETIAGALEVPTKDLTTPIGHLILAGVVTKTGTRRATRYFPVDGSKPVVASRRAKPLNGKGKGKRAGKNGKSK